MKKSDFITMIEKQIIWISEWKNEGERKEVLDCQRIRNDGVIMYLYLMNVITLDEKKELEDKNHNAYYN